MQDAFEKFLAENPELLEKARSRKPYWEKTPERQEVIVPTILVRLAAIAIFRKTI